MGGKDRVAEGVDRLSCVNPRRVILSSIILAQFWSEYSHPSCLGEGLYGAFYRSWRFFTPSSRYALSSLHAKPCPSLLPQLQQMIPPNSTKMPWILWLWIMILPPSSQKIYNFSLL